MSISAKHLHRVGIREEKDKLLKDDIEKTHKDHPSYGHRRIAYHLGINRKRALRVMNKYGIKPPRRKRKPHFCTQSTNNHSYTNLIQDISKETLVPHDIWVSDVSFIKYKGVFWYVATIEDIATRQIVGAEIGKHHNSNLILKTIQHALLTGKKPFIFHSDQGTEFMAQLITNFLKSQDIWISVSDTASPWQNGYKESFFGRFKEEFGDFNRFETIGALIEEIYSQIRYYNFDRIHTSLKMPPATYAWEKFSDNSLHKWGT